MLASNSVHFTYVTIVIEKKRHIENSVVYYITIISKVTQITTVMTVYIFLHLAVSIDKFELVNIQNALQF